MSKTNPQLAAGSGDPFDLTNLRLDQSFVETAGVKKLLTTVPVRRPNPQDFVRVHPDPEYRAALAIIELKEDREIYLVPPSIARELPGEFVMATVYTAINRQGVVFLWPVRLPAPDGRILEWHRSAAEAAELAMQRWVRVKANMSLGAYEMFEAASTIPDPEWPELSFQELLRIAFRDRLVDRLDHPVDQAAARAGLMLELPFRAGRGRRLRVRIRRPRLCRGAARSASGRVRSAWWRRSCAADRRGGSGAANSDRRHHSRSGRTRCSSPTTPAPSSVASARSAGRCRHNILDLFTEFRDRTNGLTTPAGAGLIGALTYFGLDTIGATEKDEMRALVLRGGPWSEDERAAILDYCASDVVGARAAVAGHAAAHRSAARSAARPLHGRGRRHGVHRRADRRADAGAAAASIGPTSRTS